MSQKVEILCDGCGNDLSETSNCVDYRLALSNEAVPNYSNFATLMGVSPAIKRDAHFCGVDCLRSWLDKTYPADGGPYHGGKAWAEYQRKQRAKGEERRWK